MANANSADFARPMLFDLPFIFRNYDHMKKVTRGPNGQKVYQEFTNKTGIMVIMTGVPDGARSVWNRVRPVRTPADMKGLKLGVMQTPLLVDAFALFGAIPAPMSSTEVYMAAKQGVIDGAKWGPMGMIEQKLYETAKYYTLTKHLDSPGLGGDEREVVPEPLQAPQRGDHVLAEEARAWFDSQFDKEEAAALEDVKRRGMEVIENPDIAPFVAAVRPVYDKYAERVGGWPMIQAVLDTK